MTCDICKINILYVEDDLLSTDIMIKFLNKSDICNFNVKHVKSLKDAEEELKTNKDIDIILLDLVLPNGEGLCLFNRVHDISPDLPIVIVSGYKDKALECVKAGAQDYILKPITDIDKLSYSILNAIERKKLQNELNKKCNIYISLFDGINEPIYVADPVTNEILYANNILKKLHGSHIVGEKCYKVFHSLSDICDFCTNNYIFGENLGKTHVWEFYNKKLGKWFKCIDKAIKWIDGRWVRFEMAIDITEKKEMELLLQQKEKEFEKELERRIDEMSATMKEKKKKQEKVINIFDSLISEVKGMKNEQFR